MFVAMSRAAGNTYLTNSSKFISVGVSILEIAQTMREREREGEIAKGMAI